MVYLRIRSQRTVQQAELSAQHRDPGIRAAQSSEFSTIKRDDKRNFVQESLFSIEEGAEQNITPNKFTRVAVAAGLIGPIVGIGSILAAAELSPWFSWSKNALSDILKHPMAPLFASGVMEAGISTMVYSICLAKSLTSRAANKIGAGLLAFSGAALSAVGLTSGIEHAVAASIYFFSAPAALMILGVSMYEDKPKLGGVVTMGLSAAAAAIMLTGYEIAHRFTAPFEISEAAILGGWVAVSSAALAIISKVKSRRAKKTCQESPTNVQGQLPLPF